MTKRRSVRSRSKSAHATAAASPFKSRRQRLESERAGLSNLIDKLENADAEQDPKWVQSMLRHARRRIAEITDQLSMLN